MKHYARKRRTGSVAGVGRYLPWPANLILRLRFMPNGCVEFTGSKGKYGHGSVHNGERSVGAHVACYELLIGPVPEGKELDHLCRNPSCVNPDHLEPVTHKVNMERGERARQTHCVNGHEFTPENTRIKKNGCRTCKACDRDRHNRTYAARRPENRQQQAAAERR